MLQLRFLFHLSVLVSCVTCARILIQMPIATKSETHLLTPIASSLLQRGHYVTLVTPSSSSITHPNFTEIVPIRPFDLGDLGHTDVLDIRRRKDNHWEMIFMDTSFMLEWCHQVYRHPAFQTKVLAPEKEFDLALSNFAGSECFLGLFHRKKAPYILLSSTAFLKDTFELSGLRVPLSFVPNPFIDIPSRMNFRQRLTNALISWAAQLRTLWYDLGNGERVYKTYLGEEFPPVEELRRNVSMLFSNTHFSMNFPRPGMPDMVEIGGVHIMQQEAKSLPKDLEEFCSKEFILFSLGTVFQEKTCPEELKQLFLNVFGRLKLRVLWKWGAEEEVQGLPDNVWVSKWLPQAELLAHRNIRLFISHGGLLSTQEATYHAVPVLGLPIFLDQDVNAKHVEERGYGLKLELLELTEELLETAINRLLNENSFKENAKLASEILKNQPETPLERTIYWMEYVIRYKGAPQLRSVARDLSYFQYHLYDVQLFLLGVVAVVTVALWKLFWLWLRFCAYVYGNGTVGQKNKRNSTSLTNTKKRK